MCLNCRKDDRNNTVRQSSFDSFEACCMMLLFIGVLLMCFHHISSCLIWTNQEFCSVASVLIPTWSATSFQIFGHQSVRCRHGLLCYIESQRHPQCWYIHRRLLLRMCFDDSFDNWTSLSLVRAWHLHGGTVMHRRRESRIVVSSFVWPSLVQTHSPNLKSSLTTFVIPFDRLLDCIDSSTDRYYYDYHQNVVFVQLGNSKTRNRQNLRNYGNH